MERPLVETEQPELMFKDVYMGQPSPNVSTNYDGPNFNDQYANGYHVRNQGLHGNFHQPPYNHRGPHLIVGYMLGHSNARENPQLQELEVDRNEDMYSMHNSDLSSHVDDRKYRLLEERLKVVEGKCFLGMDITGLGLVPGVRVLPRFKVHVFDKYVGTTCPKTHVRVYYRKMSAYSEDERMLMHFFQNSIYGASLEWYMHLERMYIRRWRDLVEAFVKHYQYNIYMAPNRTQLQKFTHDQNESFKEYAQKWRELAARVQPLLMERELVDMFMGTLQGLYYDRMMGSTSTGFSELVMAGERIESCLKMGKIQLANTGSFASGVGKNPFNGYPKKKKGESSVV